MAMQQAASATPNRVQDYRGRVRTGCLTCRSRKVKCDEAKPVCAKCKRLDRQCVYKTRDRHAGGHNRPRAQSPVTSASIFDTPSSSGRHEQEDPNSFAESVIASAAGSSSAESFVLEASLEARLGLQTSSDNVCTASSSQHSVRVPHATGSPASQTTSDPETGLWRPYRRRIRSDTDHYGAIESPSALISRDIQLTTTMDFITVQGSAGSNSKATLVSGPTTVFFLREVNCPGVTPFDPVNWAAAKRHAATLAETDDVVAEAIKAVCAAYRGQKLAVAIPNARPFYESARQLVEEQLKSLASNVQWEHILVAAFLICLTELVSNEEPSEVRNGTLFKDCQSLASRLEEWGRDRRMALEPMSARLVAWLRIIHRITLRGGGVGLVSDRIYNLLCRLHGEDDHFSERDVENTLDQQSSVLFLQELPIQFSNSVQRIPNLDLGPGASSEAILYQALGGPLFQFYYCLQLLSGHVARLTHYHRSRATADDQDIVAAQILQIRNSLRALWASTGTGELGAMTTCGLDAGALQSQLAPGVAGQLITVMRLCEAAYLAEMVELDRVLGDPVQRYSEASRSAVRGIMNLVDLMIKEEHGTATADARFASEEVTLASSAPAVRRRQRLNPGFLRPLFLCAIETIDDPEQTAWAVDRMSEISDPIYRSDFFAAFGQALAEAQQQKERRVTSRYFCLWYFGVSPPFM